MKKTVNAKYTPKDEQGDFAFSNVASGYGATERYFSYRGKAILPVVGEFHFSRYAREDWEKELSKMREEGLSGVSVYTFWSHIERKCGTFDFTGNNDIKAFLALCKKLDLKAVLRIGPWCHGEARYGGFPDYLKWVAGKRMSAPLYLYFVKRFWSKLFEQVREFCDGESVIAIQLENEYPFGISHIVELRKIAEEIGFKTPFFTMTAWPSDTPDKRFLPMFGGYPEAPWTQHKHKLNAQRRFAISKARSETEIGEDLLGKRDGAQKGDFRMYPYAGCEVGTGNQVTAHRRPVITDKDGYGVAFAKLASGMNFMGYYMYHGGRNPEGKPMQETRRSGYPNDYPLIDYDFQAPISKDGAIRRHGARLRLLHFFIKYWDDDFAKTETFFAEEKEMPYFSVRARQKSGYVFVSNYERGKKTQSENLDFDLSLEEKRYSIGAVAVKEDAMFFFPVGCEIGGVTFDYILAQPIAKILREDALHAYFMRLSPSCVRLCRQGKEIVSKEDTLVVEGGAGKIVLHFLEEEDALSLRFVDGRAIYFGGALYRLNDTYFAELYEGDAIKTESGNIIAKFEEQDTQKGVRLKACEKISLPYDDYLFSKGKRAYYRMTFDEALLKGEEDVQITLLAEALNVQIFWGRTLVDDYFNIDKKCVFRLGRLKDRLLERNELIIKTCAKTEKGKGAPYLEIELKNDCADVFLESAKKIKTLEIKI